MSKTILLTGASGALGSMLIPRFLDRGHRIICLEHAHRVARHKNVTVVRGDIRRSDCGLYGSRQDSLLRSVDCIVHAAASVKFADDETSRAVNVNGVENLLSLADLIGIPHFYHVSTAYIAGDADVFGEADFNVGQHLRNDYEHTKFLGERLVREWGSRKSHHRYTIFRPSILIGCEDNTTPTYSAFFAFSQAIHSIVQHIRLRARRGRERLPSGILIHSDGQVEIPLVIEASPTSTLNLIPIDWVSDMIAEQVSKLAQNDTYHLVHPEPPLVRWVFEKCLPILGAEGMKLVDTMEEKDEITRQQSGSIALFQHRLDVALGAFRPYVTHEARFLMEASRQIRGFRDPPRITSEFLGALLTFAIESNWGKSSGRDPSLARQEVIA